MKKWVVKASNSAAGTQLSHGLGVSSVTAGILTGRGVATLEEAQSFLVPALAALPDPFLLKGMEAAVERLIRARKSGELVCIYGDYDVDGISGTALLVSFLRRSGFTCTYFIPNRFDDGYGLSEDALQRIFALGAALIVSVDCGISSVKEASRCRESGIDLIIVDHHTPGEQIPDAAAVINPLQPGCSYPFKMLAGAGVAFNVLVALRSCMRKEGLFDSDGEPDLREWLDLVALGTIADVVPLVAQNRVFAYHGLLRLEKNYRAGITALKEVSGITGKVNCGQVGFRLAPRLNAAGRMESAVPGVELLLGNNAAECAAIADELNTANAERQAVERSMLEQAIAMVEGSGAYPDCRSIVLASRDWHQGVVGIVASRMVERYHRPTILIAIDELGNAKGSGRSIPGFHLLEALNECSSYLTKFGGHRYATGVGLTESGINGFALAFEAAACRILGDTELVPLLDVDAEVAPDQVTLELARELCRLEPFGSGNPEPTLMLRRVAVVERRIVGDGHLKLVVSVQGKRFNAIAFRQAECSTDGMLDIAFFPELNVWKNSTTLQLRIKSMRAAEE